MPFQTNNAQQGKLIDAVLYNADLFDAAGASITSSRERLYEHLEEGVRDLLLDSKLPTHLLHEYAIDQRALANAALSSNESSLWIPVPSDFLRLVALDLQTWDEPQYEYDIGDESKDYNRWLKGELKISSADPRAFMTMWENPSPVSWANKSAFRAVPGDTTMTTVTANGGPWTTGATSIDVDALISPIASGISLVFSSGGVFQLDTAAAVGSTSLSGILTGTVTDDSTAEHFDGISRYLYVPNNVAPENITATLKEPMLWLATAHAFTGADPFIARQCRANYVSSLTGRLVRRYKGAQRRYRGL